MNFDEYQLAAEQVAVYPRDTVKAAVSYVILGLVGEAGELANKWKKVLRDKDGELDTESRTALIQEAGDVLWYLAMLATELSIDLGVVASANIEKLVDRAARGQLHGSGDTR